jgi:type I restriction enzyme S subunit
MTKREIELLNEYRTRLIADVVTGKLDVREAAATLPEVDPLAANEEQDNTIDEDTEPGLEELDSIPEEEDP